MLFFGPIKTAQCQISEMSMFSVDMIHACPWECNRHLNHEQFIIYSGRSMNAFLYQIQT